MNRTAFAVTVATLCLGLGACATEPETSTSSPTTATASAKPQSAPGGQWVVVDDYAAESVGALKSPYLNQAVVLDAARAVDATGRLCKAPQYWESTALADAALGHPAQPQAAHDPAPRRTLTVTCDGAAFLVLVAQPDGAWLTRVNSWVLRLDRPVAKVEPVAKAEEPQPAPEPAKAKPAQDPRTLVYLASYKTDAQARAGFKALAKASPILVGQQPIVHPVDLGSKGRWIRLYGMAANEGERASLCKQLGKRVDECGARNRE